MSAFSLGRLDINLGITVAVAVARGPVDGLVVGRWQHLFVVYDGAQATNALRVRAWIDVVERTLSYTNDSPSTLVSARLHARLYPGRKHEVCRAETDLIDGMLRELVQR
jgi:hypothetical protein